jgi:hypothetical protein
MQPALVGRKEQIIFLNDDLIGVCFHLARSACPRPSTHGLRSLGNFGLFDLV